MFKAQQQWKKREFGWREQDLLLYFSLPVSQPCPHSQVHHYMGPTDVVMFSEFLGVLNAGPFKNPAPIVGPEALEILPWILSNLG